MEFNLELLRRRIKERYGRYTAFAKELNISRQLLSQKLTNKTEISRAEMVDWSKRLEISLSKIYDYFLTPIKPLP